MKYRQTEFINTIIKKRKQDGLSLRDVEAATGIQYSTIQKIENKSTTFPNLNIYIKLCAWLGVSPNEFIK